MHKKRCMTLLEMMIAMVLSLALFTALLGFYRLSQTIEQKTKEWEERLFYERQAENRLSDLFTTIPSSRNQKGNEKKDPFAFYSEANPSSLVFTYRSGGDLDPRFAHFVLGRLYVDEKKNLCLSSWPIRDPENSEEPVQHREVLLPEVESMHFSFYVPPQKKKHAVEGRHVAGAHQITDPSPKDEWHPEWKREYRRTPALLRLELARTKGGATLTYIYPLVNEEEPIRSIREAGR